MYGSFIKVGGLKLHVWEKCGADLFGLTGLEFAKTKQQWWQKQELFRSIIKSKWRLTFLPDRLMSAHWIVKQLESETNLDSYHTADEADDKVANHAGAAASIDQSASLPSSTTLMEQV